MIILFQYVNISTYNTEPATRQMISRGDFLLS